MDHLRFQNRLRQVKKALFNSLLAQKTDSAALLITSAASSPSSRDQDYLYRQNSDLLYLTGSEIHDFALLLSTNLPRPVLIGAARTKQQIVWEGPGEDLKKLAKKLNADLISTSAIEAEATKKLAGVRTLFYSSEPNSLGLKIARKLFEIPSHLRSKYPSQFVHADYILETLRLHKDSAEVEALVQANKITNTALLCALPFITPGRSEQAVAATIDYSFALQGGEPGFKSIVASGKNAATLHHKPSSKKLKKGEMVLLDVGARLNHYCADITRVVPVGEKFSSVHSEVYEVVLSSQFAALKKIKHGVLAKVVYDAAVKELAAGLKDLGIIKAPVSRIISKQLFKPFFPHGIGHTLGLDVHDIGNLRSDVGIKLEKGMVITVEPGLYFSKEIKSVPACGVRIEDNVLVTQSGCTVLSSGFPKSIKEIEKLIF